jgi:hypothetical protein
VRLRSGSSGGRGSGLSSRRRTSSDLTSLGLVSFWIMLDCRSADVSVVPWTAGSGASFVVQTSFRSIGLAFCNPASAHDDSRPPCAYPSRLHGPGGRRWRPCRWAKAAPYSQTDKGEFILDNSGRASTKTSISDEIAHLRGLDIKGLRSRWQKRIFQRPPPDHLPRHLLFAIIAYRIQADRFGDLDHETRQVP